MGEDLSAHVAALTAGLDPETTAIVSSLLSTLTPSGAFPGGPFGRVLGIRFTAFGEGRCSAEVDVTPHLLNPLGIAHGGVTFALADFACGGAALSALGEPRLVTQDMQIRYHGPARPGRLVASANTLHKGSRTITTECQIRQNGVLVASATGTFAILSATELGAIQKPDRGAPP